MADSLFPCPHSVRNTKTIHSTKPSENGLWAGNLLELLSVGIQDLENNFIFLQDSRQFLFHELLASLILLKFRHENLYQSKTCIPTRDFIGNTSFLKCWTQYSTHCHGSVRLSTSSQSWGWQHFSRPGAGCQSGVLISITACCWLPALLEWHDVNLASDMRYLTKQTNVLVLMEKKGFGPV